MVPIPAQCSGASMTSVTPALVGQHVAAAVHLDVRSGALVSSPAPVGTTSVRSAPPADAETPRRSGLRRAAGTSLFSVEGCFAADGKRGPDVLGHPMATC